MEGRPIVSVLMAVHQGERFLREAVESVLAQSFEEFELLVVDDGSTDATGDILASYDDPRLRVVRNDRNIGLPRSLNRGLEEVRAPLVARLDADDAAEPDRLARQLEVMCARPDLDILGSWTTEVDEAGRETGAFRFPASEALIRWGMAVTNVVYHPTVLMRLETLERLGGYDPSVQCAEDYDLFTRVLLSGGRIDVVPEQLIRYRRNPDQVSVRRNERQKADALGVRRRYVAGLVGEEPDPGALEAIGALRSDGPSPSRKALREAVRLERRIREWCLEQADAEGRRLIRSFGRPGLVRRSERLRREGRLGDAAIVWAEIMRADPRSWRRPGVWRGALRLVQAGLGRGPR